MTPAAQASADREAQAQRERAVLNAIPASVANDVTMYVKTLVCAQYPTHRMSEHG